MPQTSLLWLCSGEVWGRDKDLLKLQTMCISASVSFYVCMYVCVCFVLVHWCIHLHFTTFWICILWYEIADIHWPHCLWQLANFCILHDHLNLFMRVCKHVGDFLALQFALKDIKNRGEKCKIEQIKRMKLFMLHCRMTQKTVVLVTFLWEYCVPKHSLWAPCACICAMLLVPMGSINKV